MRINPDTGFFDTQPRETLTICVTAKKTGYVATFSNPTCTTWSSGQGPTDGKECRQFTMPAKGDCVVVITFTFQSDATGAFPPGAAYVIDVSGSAGGSFQESVEPPPAVQGRQYTFHVV